MCERGSRLFASVDVSRHSRPRDKGIDGNLRTNAKSQTVTDSGIGTRVGRYLRVYKTAARQWRSNRKEQGSGVERRGGEWWGRRVRRY